MYTGGAARKYPNTGHQRIPLLQQQVPKDEFIYSNTYTRNGIPSRVRGNGKEVYVGDGPGKPTSKSSIVYDKFDMEEQQSYARGKPSLSTFSSKIVERDSKKYIEKHRIHEFDEINFNLSIRLSDIDASCQKITKIPFDIFSGRGNSKKDYLSTTSKIFVGSLSINSSVLENIDPRSLFISFSSVRNTVLGRDYHFKLVPDSGSTVFENNIIYKPDFDDFKPYTWIKFTEGTLTISDMCGEICFDNPCRNGMTSDGTTITTTTELEVGDLICVKCATNVRAMVTTVGDGFIIIDANIPIGNVDFVVLKWDFDLSIRAVGVVQDNTVIGVRT